VSKYKAGSSVDWSPTIVFAVAGYGNRMIYGGAGHYLEVTWLVNEERRILTPYRMNRLKKCHS